MYLTRMYVIISRGVMVYTVLFAHAGLHVHL